MKKGVYIFWSVFIVAALFRVLQSLDVKPVDIGLCLHSMVSGVGIITDEPERNETGQILIVHVERMQAVTPTSTETCPSDLLIRLKTKLYPRFAYGDHISFTGKLLVPINFSEKDGREFDYQGYLAKDNIYFEIRSAVVTSSAANPIASARLGSITTSIESLLFNIKNRFVRVLNETLGEPHAALASGLVVGERSSLGTDLLNDFRIVGLIHIVVLSGYNITVVSDAMRRLLSFLPRMWGITVGGVGILLFGVMAGGGATVVRSCFMAAVALSADLIRREYDVTRALMFAGLVMLIQNPMILLHDPSFQLSFLATLGLIVLAAPIEERLGFIPDRFGMRGVVASTLATQISVAPYILYMMGQISIVGMFVNIIVLPFIPATMLAVCATGVMGMIWLPAGQVIAWTAHILLSYELFVVKNIARLPFAAAHVQPFSIWWVVGFYAVLFVVAYDFLAEAKLASITLQLRLAKKSSM